LVDVLDNSTRYHQAFSENLFLEDVGEKTREDFGYTDNTQNIEVKIFNYDELIDIVCDDEFETKGTDQLTEEPFQIGEMSDTDQVKSPKGTETLGIGSIFLQHWGNNVCIFNGLS
jgi:hypothetical protein